MRSDIVGMFWDDTPAIKVLKEKLKRTPPPRVWEDPSYLPGLEQACSYVPDLFTLQELIHAAASGSTLVYDVEVYPNYFCVGFECCSTGKQILFEMDEAHSLDLDFLKWVYASFTLVGFNNLFYDAIIMSLVLGGCTTSQLQWATEELILRNTNGSDIMRAYKLPLIKSNQIDLLPVAPLSGSLKAYGGRLHAPRLQDLPFAPGTILSTEQKLIVRWYNGNDLKLTKLVWQELREQLALRDRLGQQYGLDLRSKSDAQIAEAVITSELVRKTRGRLRRAQIAPGSSFRYSPASYLLFRTRALQDALSTVCAAEFTIAPNGTVEMPASLHSLTVEIGGNVYRMGIGGLHSSEQRQIRFSSSSHILYDRDVTSYYPKLILNSGMFPEHLGPMFLGTYSAIVEARIAAKRAKDNITADSLKIVVNGTFGKTGSPYSFFYAPRMMIQVTVGGQLAILLLIERLVMAGIEVVSANTDGITVYCPQPLQAVYEATVRQWELDTNLPTEETSYRSIFIRDVNNYIAVKIDGSVKAKGAFSNPWSDPKQAIFRFHKNPVTPICTQAVHDYVVTGKPLVQTIHECNDMSQFMTLRNVKGGAVKEGVYLGKVIRWYYGEEEGGEIIYASTGNKVPRSEGAVPCMDLPRHVLNNLNRAWYVREADAMLCSLGLASTLFQESV